MTDAARLYENEYQLAEQVNDDFNDAIDKQVEVVKQEIKDGEINPLDLMEDIQKPFNQKYLMECLKFCENTDNYEALGLFFKRMLSMGMTDEATSRALKEVM